MIGKLLVPRLLPVTIVAIALLLSMKSVQLVRAATGTAAGGGQASPAAVLTPAQMPAAPAVAPVPSVAGAPVAGAAPVPAAVPAAAAAPVPSGAPPPVSDSERTLLLELRERRQEIDTREATLAARESMLVAAQQKLGSRVTELQALQKTLETLDAARKQREDAGWQGLVKVYEVMKPREAATIFNELDMPVLLQVVDRMKEAKAAPILAAMVPDKARDVTTQLAQIRTRRDNPAVGATGG